MKTNTKKQTSVSLAELTDSELCALIEKTLVEGALSDDFLNDEDCDNDWGFE